VLAGAAVCVTACVAAGSAAADDGVVVRTTVAPHAVGLGEPFVYSVEVRGPAGMTVFADTAPFVAAAPPRRSRSDGGRLVRIEQRLLCLDRACEPDRRSRLVSLPRVRVVSGGAPTLGARVAVTVVPHVPEAAVKASRAQYRVDSTVRAPGAPWRTTFAALMVLAIAALLAAALMLIRRARPAAAGVGSLGRPGGLAHALRLLRESARRPVPDRRRAADYVARAVSCERGDAAAEASRIAWSAPDPQPPEVVALADRVEGASDT
jgi:hypothetical protein